MRSKFLIMVIFLVFLVGCKKTTPSNLVDSPTPGEVKVIEVYKPELDVEKVEITLENFMEKVALLDLALEKIELSDGRGVYLKESYTGLSGNTFAMYNVYTEEEKIAEDFNFFRVEYGDLAMSSTGELVEDSEDTFIVKKENAFVGFKKSGNTLIFLSTEDRGGDAERVFSCF